MMNHHFGSHVWIWALPAPARFWSSSVTAMGKTSEPTRWFFAWKNGGVSSSFCWFLLVDGWMIEVRLRGFGISWELLVGFAVIWLPASQNLILPSWTNPIYICWPMLIRTFTYPVWLLLDIDPSSYPNFWMSTDFARFPTKKWWIMMYHLSQMWIAVYIHGGWLLQPLFFKSNLLIQLQFPQDSIHGNNGEFLPLIMPFSWNQNCFLCWNFLTNPGWSLTPGVFSVGYSLRLI